MTSISFVEGHQLCELNNAFRSYIRFVSGWMMACSKSPITFKGDCAADSPSALCDPPPPPPPHQPPPVFFMCAQLCTRSKVKTTWDTHTCCSLALELPYVACKLKHTAHCTLHVARCSLRVAAALIYCLLLPWLWFAIFSRISMATWPGYAPLRVPESGVPHAHALLAR